MDATATVDGQIVRVFETSGHAFECRLTTFWDSTCGEHGTIWFIGFEAGKAVGHEHETNSRRAIRAYVRHDQKLKWADLRLRLAKNDVALLFPHLDPQTIMLSEPGFWQLLLQSRTQKARYCQDWVTHDVLPTIRRTGRYDAREAPNTEENTSQGMMNPEECVPSASTSRASAETDVQPPKRKRKAETRKSLSSEAVLPFVKFALLVKEASGLSGAPLKRLLYTAGARFMEMMAREHPEMSPQELQRKYRQTLAGSSIEVPPGEVVMAKACIEASLAGSSSTTLALRGPIRIETTRRRIIKRFRVFEAKSKQHAAAKDAANAEWISLMTQHNCLSGPLAYLDAFVGSGGFKLRTTEALLAAGVSTHRLYSANLDAGIVKALKDKGVHAAVGCWEEALPYDGKPFTGVFLDLCQGSAAQLMGHLAALKPMCAVGCVLGMTIIQRDFDGEPLLMRVARIVDFLGKQGWKLARGGLAPSMLPYRGTVGTTVASIFYILSRL